MATDSSIERFYGIPVVEYNQVSDKFLSSGKLSRGVIVNLIDSNVDPSGAVGHFISLKLEGDILKFFDPYGLKSFEARDILNQIDRVELDPFYIRDFAYRHSYKLEYNPIQYQSLKIYRSGDDLCGFYSAMSLLRPNDPSIFYERNESQREAFDYKVKRNPKWIPLLDPQLRDRPT